MPVSGSNLHVKEGQFTANMAGTKPVCVGCALFFRPKKNGVYFIEGMPVMDKGNKTWVPYKLWSGDLWECNSCGGQLVISANQEIAIQHEPDFKRLVESYKAGWLIVNDC